MASLFIFVLVQSPRKTAGSLVVGEAFGVSDKHLSWPVNVKKSLFTIFLAELVTSWQNHPQFQLFDGGLILS